MRQVAVCKKKTVMDLLKPGLNEMGPFCTADILCICSASIALIPTTQLLLTVCPFCQKRKSGCACNIIALKLRATQPVNLRHKLSVSVFNQSSEHIFISQSLGMVECVFMCMYDFCVCVVLETYGNGIV